MNVLNMFQKKSFGSFLCAIFFHFCVILDLGEYKQVATKNADPCVMI